MKPTAVAITQDDVMIRNFFMVYLAQVYATEMRRVEFGSTMSTPTIPDEFFGKYVMRLSASRLARGRFGLDRQQELVESGLGESVNLPKEIVKRIEEHGSRYAPALLRAAKAGVQVFCPYCSTFDLRMYGVKGREGWTIDHGEWDYAFTTMWASRAHRKETFLPDEALCFAKRFGDEEGELGSLVSAHRTDMGTPEMAERLQTDDREAQERAKLDILVHGCFRYYHYNHRIRNGLHLPVPAHGFSEAQVWAHAGHPVFRKNPGRSKPKILFCQVGLEAQAGDTVRFCAIDLDTCRLFDPRIGVLCWPDGQKEKVIPFVLEHWITDFQPGKKARRVAFYPYGVS